jgi:hypothetical protein
MSPLNEAQMEMFRASSKVRVLELMIAMVAGGHLYVEEGGEMPYLAYVSHAEGLGNIC